MSRNTPLTIQFVGDVMLGKLCDYLLHAGYDCAYYRHIEDDRLLRVARRQQRVLLTRDRHLVERMSPSVSGLFVHGDDLENQFAQVVKRYDLEVSEGWIFTRCSHCNNELTEIRFEAAAPDLPPATREWVQTVFRCTDCGRLYWQGSHYRAIRSTLAEWGYLEN